MTKNPFINAIIAVIYIAAVASVMFFGPKNVGPIDSILGPIAFLSLFTLSAAVMGFVFLYQPLLLYVDKKKKLAIQLFFKTLGTFAAITVVLLFLLFSGILG